MIRILLVEDEPAMRLLVQEYLELFDYEVAPAPDGETAVDLASRGSFTVAFVDINLPGISGVEVIRRLRSEGNTTPMVVLSGNLRDSYAKEIQDLDIVEILEKPIDLDELDRVIRSVTGGTATPI